MASGAILVETDDTPDHDTRWPPIRECRRVWRDRHVDLAGTEIPN